MVSPTALAWMMNWSDDRAVAGLPVDPVVQKPGPPSDWALKMPVSSAPVIPPTPCTPNTSSESSAPSIFFRPGDTPQADQAGDQADDERARNADVAGRRRDRHQTRNRTRSGTEHRGLALDQPLGQRPGQHRAGGGQEGVHEGERGRCRWLPERSRR